MAKRDKIRSSGIKKFTYYMWIDYLMSTPRTCKLMTPKQKASIDIRKDGNSVGNYNSVYYS